MSSSTLSLTAIVLGALLAAAGCSDPPPLAIRYRLASGPTQACGKQNCSEIGVACDAVLSLRILDPAQPSRPLVAICERVNSPKDLCSIERVNLPPNVQLPARRLAVQVALFNADDIPLVGEALTCPDLPFDGNNFAAPSPHKPALAGMAYYSPGDAETVVELGCADLGVVNTPVCRNEDLVRITASLEDFDTGQPVTAPVADRMELRVGEPRSRLVDNQVQFYFAPDSTKPLARVPDTIQPSWLSEVSLYFTDAACVEAHEDTAQATTTITCKAAEPDDTELDLPAVRLSRDTLDDVLRARAPSKPFPSEGLVIGKVVDRAGRPVKDVTVRVSDLSPVLYLSAARDQLVEGATSDNGIFVSFDAGFLSSWTAAGTTGGYGGRVHNRVTIVILQPAADDP